MKRLAIAVVASGLLSLGAMGTPAKAALPTAVNGEKMPSLSPIVKEVRPAVVNISTTSKIEVRQHPFFKDPFFRRFFDVPENMPREREAQSLGSGVIVDADEGIIVTNHHVIRKADQITVALSDTREFEAKVIGSDPETDVAVIKIDAENLSELPLADSGKLDVGDFVVAIGNPFGLQHTVTSGIVSGLGRSKLRGLKIQDFIQTDASINPGNSGGALVNLRGELVGVNTAILSQSGGNIGIGFAIPSNIVKTVIDQIRKYGEVKRGVLGVQVQDLNADIAQALDLERQRGALVAQVVDGSAAEKAGIKQGDVVVAVNGENVKSAQDLATKIGLMPIGSEVDITLYREGEEITVTATISDPEETQVAASGLHPKLKGAQFAELDERSPLFGKVQGVLVTDVQPGSPAANAGRVGLRPGDVITSVNREPVKNLSQFREAVEGADRLLLNIRRGNSALFLLIK